MNYIRNFLVIATSILTLPALGQDYDLVITNGRVIDPETKLDAVRNVGIKNGRIEVVTDQTLTAKETIDASGLVVAPGFIDLHVHGQDPYSIKIGLRDGVTSPLEIEAGAYPIEAYYKQREGKSQANYGASVSHPYVRLAVLDGIDIPGGLVLYSDAINKAAQDGSKWSTQRTAAGSKERSAIVAAVEQGLRQGGLGIGFPVGYYTEVSSGEVAEVATLAKRYDTFITTHVRYLSQVPPSGFLGLQEMLAVAEVNEVPLLVHHVPSNCLALTGEVLTYLNVARRNGVRVATEFYPYTRGSSIIGADYLGPGFQEKTGMDYGDITMVATNEKLTKETYEKYRREQPGAAMIMNHIKEADMMRAFVDPYCFVGSDAFPYIDADGKPLPWDAPYEAGRAHPRGAGTHAKTLRMVREQKVIPLMEAVAKLSYFQAKFLEDSAPEMRKRGRIQPGAIADITIFDPATVTDNSDYPIGKAGLPSTGIPFVVVNGTIVVKDSEVLKDVYPGQAIRGRVLD
jgi:hypothetical protein